MKRLDLLKESLLGTAREPREAGHLRLLLEYYADRVDSQIQTELMNDLMARYAAAARQLENQNSALQESDFRLREAQHIALIGDWEVDPVRQTVEWSESMTAILEMEPGETISPESYYRKVHPDDLAKVKDITRRIVAGDLPAEQRYRLQMSDGRVKWVRILYSPYQHEDLGYPMVRGIMQDITEQQLLEEQLKRYNTQLEEMVRQQVEEITEANLATIYALVKLSESRDDDTGNHIERTASYCRLIAEELRAQEPYHKQIDDAFIHNITMASPLHDIGKVGIPDAILLKPGKLTAEEFTVMKTHVIIGYETLSSLQTRYAANSFLQFGMDIARYHHEKWDGSGYMRGLSGEGIPLPARIMALADVYDALRSRRVYKPPFSHQKSAEIIIGGSGSHFDPALIDVFERKHEAFAAIYDNMA